MRDETILCVATRTWDSLWRESQQIMSRMAKHNQIFYFEPGRDVQEPILKAFRRTWRNFFRLESRSLNENLILIPSPSQIPIGRRHLPASILKVTMPLVVKLNARFLIQHMQRAVKAFHIKDPILWLYSPYHTDLVGKFGEKLSCYQNYDEFSEYIYNERISELVQKYDNQLCMSVDLVFATSRSQASRRKTLNPDKKDREILEEMFAKTPLKNIPKTEREKILEIFENYSDVFSFIADNFGHYRRYFKKE